MKIEDKRNDNKKMCAGIGDILVTDSKWYLLLDSQVNEEYPIAVCDLVNNCIAFTTCQSVFCIGGSLRFETIVEIIPRDRLKLVIE